MIVVYVAGPFRGPTSWDIAENIRNAERLALQVWQLGEAAICPHTNAPQHFGGAVSESVIMDGELEIISRCDAVLLTPDWKKSVGATEERKYAESLGLPVFETIDALKTWLVEPIPAA